MKFESLSVDSWKSIKNSWNKVREQNFYKGKYHFFDTV